MTNISTPSAIYIQDPTILVMVSGGLDSLGMLYTLMTNPLYVGFAVHAHHVNLVNQEHRYEAEAMAVQGALRWFAEHMPSQRLTSSQSTMEIPSVNQGFPWDVDAINFVAGNMMMCSANLIFAALGKTKTDNDHGLPDYRDRLQRGINMFGLYARLDQKLHPVSGYTKQEIWDFLPPTLRKWSWTCRTPVRIPGGFKECGRCRSCTTELNPETLTREPHVLTLG